MPTYNDTLTESIVTNSSDSEFTTTPITISNDLIMNGLTFPSLPYMPISEVIVFDTTTSFSRGILVLESLLIDSLDTTSLSTSSAISEVLVLLDSIRIAYEGSITEIVTILDVASIVTNNIQIVSESLVINSSATNIANFINTLVDLITILDSASFAIHKTITESIIIEDGLTSLYKAITILLDSIVIEHSSTDKLINIVSLSSAMNFSTEDGSNASLVELLTDSFIISIPTASGQDSYIGWLLSPETASVTNYSNYNFDGACKWNGEYYFFNSSGLYKYGGSTDDGETIRSIVTFSALSFGTSNKKIIPSIYLGATNSGGLILKVRHDGRGEVYYKINKYTNNLQTQKIDIGKGLMARYFQFELIIDASDFDMESIEFLPMEIKRKI